jgi:hypothetical protein
LADQTVRSYIHMLTGLVSVPSQKDKKPDVNKFNVHYAFIMPYGGQSHFGVADECRKAFTAAGINYVKDPAMSNDEMFGDYAVNFSYSSSHPKVNSHFLSAIPQPAKRNVFVISGSPSPDREVWINGSLSKSQIGTRRKRNSPRLPCRKS